MKGTWIRPARVILSILMAPVTIALPPAAHAQAPAPGGIPIPAPLVPTLPAGAGEIGLTIILLMLAAIAAVGVWAELSR